MAYDIDFNTKGILKLHIRKFLLHPPRWKKSTFKLNRKLKWYSVKFEKNKTSFIPNTKGVYCFVLIPGYLNFFETRYLFYAGKTNRTLRERYSEYLNDQAGKGKPRSKVHEMLNLYKDDIHFWYTSINDKKTVNKYEDAIINTFVPHINTNVPDAKINHELKNIYE